MLSFLSVCMCIYLPVSLSLSVGVAGVRREDVLACPRLTSDASSPSGFPSVFAHPQRRYTYLCLSTCACISGLYLHVQIGTYIFEPAPPLRPVCLHRMFSTVIRIADSQARLLLRVFSSLGKSRGKILDSYRSRDEEKQRTAR